MAIDARQQVAAFLDDRNIDPACMDKLDKYVQCLLQWNQNINLIGKTTEAEIWQRHILDCVQLVDYLPGNAKRLLDVGSGAGLPGLVLSILDVVEVQLVESIQKKVSFLKAASLECGALPVIHCERVENLMIDSVDVITARAFASLSDIFSYTQHLVGKEHLYLLLKGSNFNSELVDAEQKGWAFDVTSHSSVVEGRNSGVVLDIRHVQRA